MTVEYDPSLSQFLIDEGFTRGDMSQIIGPGYAYPGNKFETTNHIGLIVERFQAGTIIILPAQGFFEDPYRADWKIVFYSPFTADEIRKRVALKAFL